MARFDTTAATMQDVARLAGVSVKTVSNVLSDYPHVRPATRERVLVAVRELDYQINVSARNLRSGRTHAIGLAVPELSQAYFAELADAVIRAASEHGYTVLIEQTSARRSTEIETITGMGRHAIDGLIFAPLALGPEDVRYLEADFPIVVLGERILHSPADHVTMSNAQAARAATEHLIANGRRRIAVIGAHPDEPEGTATMRLRGYLDALTDAGIEADPALIAVARLWHRAEGENAARQLLARQAEVDAIFCFNDALALGAMRALQSSGVRIPEDIALVGFDDVEDARYSTPSLTTVSPGRDQIASNAVAMLIARIEGDEMGEAPVHVEADFQLVVRESSGGVTGATRPGPPRP